MSKKRKNPLYGLHPKHARKANRDFIDFDYVSRLSEDEKLWLNQFSHEFYQARFLNDTKNLHDDQESQRACYGANNARNRDIWNKQTKSRVPPPSHFGSRLDLIEDAIIDRIDEEDE